MDDAARLRVACWKLLFLAALRSGEAMPGHCDHSHLGELVRSAALPPTARSSRGVIAVRRERRTVGQRLYQKSSRITTPLPRCMPTADRLVGS